MSIEITMPKLSDTMEEGTILRWLKHLGEPVAKGEVLAEVETDKADMELEAEQSGTLSEIRVKEGGSAPVGAVIAVLDDARAAAVAPQPAPAAPTPRAPAPPKPSAPPPPASATSAKGVAAAPPPSARGACPPGGAPPPPATKWTPRQVTEPQPAPSGRQEESKLRLAVAKQMAAAKRDIPHFYVTAEIDMSDAARLRAQLTASDTVPERITYTHLIIRALALTLPRHPRVNASWSEGGIIYHDDINIGVAVAIEDGLVAPVLRGCQNLSLRQIARVTAELVDKAQAGRFGGDELTGGTFTISNMGMLDIEEFSAVLIPPQAAILAVGSIKDRAIVRDGHLAVAKTMRATLSVDHRILNGVEAGRFLEDLKRILENPAVLVIGPE
ncbi:MAG TPA: dihydrolipoamide acetyltransferase family protein [Candidatus Margulisiibacteriota bacterium]|nr:dihydrolipoamide acetyltransferase family protein [Candidatus Margulisiibacteriota bacterium]